MLSVSEKDKIARKAMGTEENQIKSRIAEIDAKTREIQAFLFGISVAEKLQMQQDYFDKRIVLLKEMHFTDARMLNSALTNNRRLSEASGMMAKTVKQHDGLSNMVLENLAEERKIWVNELSKRTTKVLMGQVGEVGLEQGDMQGTSDLHPSTW